MDPVEQELLDAVLAAPDDDAPRLVYADWLQQRGDPRGEFIVLQCRPELFEGDVFERAWRLEQEHRAAWLAPLAFIELGPARFVRGFVERLELEAADWVRHGESLCAWTPVREICVRRVHALADVLASPAMARVRQCEVRGEELREPALRGLERVPPLPALESVVLLQTGLDDTALRALAAWPGAAPRQLLLDLNKFGARGLAALLGSPLAARLEVLSLDYVRVENGAAAAIAGASALRRISLMQTGMTGYGLQILARKLTSVEALVATAAKSVDPATIHAMGAWRRLRSLSLGETDAGDDGVEALCAVAGALPELRELDLHACGITSRGAAALIASPLRLSSLKLYNNRLPSADRAALVERFGGALLV